MAPNQLEVEHLGEHEGEHHEERQADGDQAQSETPVPEELDGQHRVLRPSFPPHEQNSENQTQCSEAHDLITGPPGAWPLYDGVQYRA